MRYDNQFKMKIIVIRSTHKAKYNTFSFITKINYNNIRNRLLLTKTFFFFYLQYCATSDIFH